MKFKQGTRRKAIDYEKEIINYWQQHKTFEKSVANRPKNNTYVFYDGPPFITGVPHHGTLLSSIVKDAVPRYWTMKGKRVERVWGWDCHGLPAEVFTERKLGIKDKRDVYKIGLETYIKTCRENMIQTGSEWEDTIARVGRWVDFRGAYKTMDNDYMESVWWAFKKLYEAGKIYEGEKVLLYCTRDATPLSKAEVAMDNNSYKYITDPSVYIKFKLKNEDTYLLAWTTTPWTLPANVAVAVNKNLTYAEVEVEKQKFILAKELLDKVLRDKEQRPLTYKVLRSFKGKELVGRKVEPLFEDHGDKAHTVYHEDYVGTKEGTGIVHSAPAYGEEDFMMAREDGIPIVSVVDEHGFYMNGDWKGQYVWDVDEEIAKTLYERGIVWRIEPIRHSYPHCHRCGTKLMYRAHPSWFMDIDSQRHLMLDKNSDIYWFPPHIKEGRFTKTVQSAPDWNLSRDRFWATPIPVWKGVDEQGQELIRVIGSFDELEQLSGKRLKDYHRPWIDDVTFEIEGVLYKRIDKVMDSWFESGSMPFAQFHYPFENVEKFEQNFPGDFIAEYVGQVRAWFYYLHAVSVGLFGEKAFKNVVVTGTLAGRDGRKMSKSYGNYTDPNELMDTYSADALRYLLLSSPLLNGEDFSLVDKDVADICRKLNMVWNMYDFFTTYAEVDGWEWDGNLDDPSPDLKHPLDQWIVSRTHQVTEELDKYMQAYDLPNATRPLLEFLEDTSNWYIRRSRKRFWKSQNDKDKQLAYRTLHYVLVQTSTIFAPFTPFLAEELYRKLTEEESVHLLDWPDTGYINKLVIDRMSYVRSVINEGLSQRATAGIKVRQPLRELSIKGAPKFFKDIEQEYIQIIEEELNVKKVLASIREEAHEVTLNTSITPELKREGMMREAVRYIQSSRKKAGLKVDDRIELRLTAENEELNRAVHEHADTIKQETLAVSLNETEPSQYTASLEIDGEKFELGLAKAL
jgi:isoleucyl-tRNA synthetase